MKLMKVITLLICAALFFVACGQPDSTMDDSQALTVAIGTSPTCLDGDSVTIQIVNNIMSHVYEGLFEFNASYEAVPHLAESYEMLDEGRTYTITLRQGVKFHNGKEMKSEDVIASFERWLRLNGTGQSVARYLDKYTAEGDYRVNITFVEPYAPFLQMISANVSNQKLMIRPKELCEKYSDSIMTEYIGTGPYRLEEYKPDQYIMLKKYEEYLPAPGESSGFSGTRSAIAERLKFVIVPELAVRVAGVQSGEYHFATDISSDQYPVLSDDSRVQTYITSPNYQLLLVFNQGGKIFKDVKARMAVAVGVDVEELASLGVGSKEFWHLNPCLFAQTSQWYDETSGEGVYNSKDLDRAKQLLSESSYDGSTVIIMNQRSNTVYVQTATALKTQLEAIGFNVELELLDDATVVEKRKSTEGWDIVVNSFIAPDPDPQVYGAWMGTNKWIGHWDDEQSRQMDKIFDRMLTSVDQNERYDIVCEWYDKFYETIPYVKLVDYDGLYISAKGLSGYQNYTTPFFWDVKPD